MSRIAMISALLIGAAACAAASEPAETPAPLQAPALVEAAAPVAALYEAAPAHYASAAPACAIDVTRINGGVRLEARAFDLADARGPLEYDFVVTKQGAAGSSDIVQGGEVSEEHVGSVDLSMERGARYRARLTLSDADGEVCSTQVRS